MNFQYKIADKKYLHEIFDIEKICFPNEFWSSESIKSEFDNERCVCMIATSDDSKVLGYVFASVIFDECELNRIAVLPEYRKMKIGKKLLDNLIEYTKKLGCKTVYLEVRENNLPAIGLYNCIGFKKIGIRKNYYKNPTENAILMSVEI